MALLQIIPAGAAHFVGGPLCFSQLFRMTRTRRDNFAPITGITAPGRIVVLVTEWVRIISVMRIGAAAETADAGFGIGFLFRCKVKFHFRHLLL